jgi:hypothetical protein
VNAIQQIKHNSLYRYQDFRYKPPKTSNTLNV